MANVYYSPEKFGLKIFGELDFGGSYEFDKFVVWTMEGQDPEGRPIKAVLWGSDSGCSCPVPFDYVGLSDLNSGTPQACMRALQQWHAGFSEYRQDQDQYVRMLERLIQL